MTLSLPSNAMTALITGCCLIVVALIGGWFTFRKNKNDYSISVWEQYRKDNERLTKRVDDLEEKIDKALEETKTHKAEREKAEASCAAAEARASAAEEVLARERELSAKLQVAYEGEHAACAILHHLYDGLMEGRPADPALLASIQSRLIDVGFLPATPAAPPAAG